MNDELRHYGTPRHSGRYPWGSGKNPQRNKNLYRRAQELKAQGRTEREIANTLHMTTTEYRALYSIAKDEARAERDNRVRVLKEKGWANTKIAGELGISEANVRNILNDTAKTKDATRQLADELKRQLEEKPYLDVGKGVELQLGTNSTRKNTALAMLEQEGYKVHQFDVSQATNPQQKTHIEVLTKGDVSYSDVREHQWQITSPGGAYFSDFGLIKNEVKPPVSIDSDRIEVRYDEQGGSNKDGVIEIRPGSTDLYLGNNQNYAQVRIAVDGTHYLKGMAVYGDPKDFPEGKDIIFNTNKHEGTPILGSKDNSVLKGLKDSEENPFGAVTRQWNYTDADGNEHQSPINIVNSDSDWDKWSKNLSAQFLSKQPTALAKKQLDITYKEKEEEFKEIKSLTNPTIKKKLLESFADDCDSAAVDLKAAAFPRQATHVILPIPSLKDNEVFAPNYDNGEEVVLIRYPHGGIFEIPRLKVNNNNEEALRVIGNKAPHAIGINAHVAEQLSGADFDGDTVVVIPTKGINIKTMAGLEGLKDYDPKRRYPAYEGMPRVGKEDTFHKQAQMGSVSNLITDMHVMGADWNEIAAAVRHSMTVIDAEKHNLDWKQSEKDNHIAELKEKYQGGANRGAATLISRASSEERPLERKELRVQSQMTPEQREAYLEGHKVYEYTNRVTTEKYIKGVPEKAYYKSQANAIMDRRVAEAKTEHPDWGRDEVKKFRKSIEKDALSEAKKEEISKSDITWEKTNKLANGPKSTKMAETEDAFTLSSTGNRETARRIEQVYGDHANKLKALANAARKEYLNTPNLQYSKEAREAYAEERRSLLGQLQQCLLNSPLERQAQLMADRQFKDAKKAHPDWDKDDEKKNRAIFIKLARDTVEATSRKTLAIKITDRQWDAIQAGAISENTLREILRFADLDSVRQKAMPRESTALSRGQLARARALMRNGHTSAEVAAALGISTSTLYKALDAA